MSASKPTGSWERLAITERFLTQELSISLTARSHSTSNSFTSGWVISGRFQLQEFSITFSFSFTIVGFHLLLRHILRNILLFRDTPIGQIWIHIMMLTYTWVLSWLHHPQDWRLHPVVPSFTILLPQWTYVTVAENPPVLSFLARTRQWTLYKMYLSLWSLILENADIPLWRVSYFIPNL